MSLYIGWSLATIIFLGGLAVKDKLELYAFERILEELNVTEEEFQSAKNRLVNRK